MRADEMKPFLNKTIKLVKIDGFWIVGRITEIYEDSILFESDQATALINLGAIRELQLKKKEESEK